MLTEMITKEQVEEAIDAANAKKISSGESGTAVWAISGAWEAATITLRGNITEQTETLTKELTKLHDASEIELLEGKDTIGKLGTLGSGLLRLVNGKSPTSWFDSVIGAMKKFGQYVTQTLEDKMKSPTPKDKKDVKDLAAQVTGMVERYVDHSLYRKIVPALASQFKGKSIPEIFAQKSLKLDSTKTLIGTLCACVNYGALRTFSDSWMKHILKLTN